MYLANRLCAECFISLGLRAASDYLRRDQLMLLPAQKHLMLRDCLATLNPDLGLDHSSGDLRLVIAEEAL